MRKSNPALFLLPFAIAAAALSCDPRLLNLGRGSVSISLGAGARTALPTIEAASYVLTFEGPVAHAPETLTGTTTTTLTLAVGQWSIAAEARNASNQPIARGSSNVAIVSGRNDVAIVLSPLVEGTGSVDLRMTWPAGLSPAVDGALITRQRPADASATTVSADRFTLTTGGAPPSLAYAEDLAAGDYTLVVSLMSGAETLYTYDTAMRVETNLTTRISLDLNENHFTPAPEAPTNLTATRQPDGTVDLSWTDRSNVETGFVVQRATAEAGPWTQLSTPAANATAFTDATARAGITYFYRVGAVNSKGTVYSAVASAPAATGSVVITITVERPSDLPMTLAFDPAPVGGVLQVTDGTFNVSVVETGYASYAWYLDRSPIGTGTSCRIDLSATTPGAHRLTLFVLDGGRLYSTAAEFRIHN